VNAAEVLQEGVVGIEQAKQFSGIGRTALYGLMERGELPYTKVGARRLIPLAGLKAVLARGLIGVPGLSRPAESVEPPALPARKIDSRPRRPS
jgi:hypothetical protein